MGTVKFLAVSTFSAAGLSLYGRRMMESFAQNWSETASLHVYAEGWRERFAGVSVFDLETASPWLGMFKARHAHRPTTNFRMDAVRFSHKVAALCHAARHGDADFLIWLDGDIVTHSPITIADLEWLAPKDDEWIAWLDRDRIYPECGLYVLNCRHSRHKEAMATFEAMYTEDLLFALPEWHDSFVLEHVVKTLGMGAKSLSGAGRRTSHPLVNSELGQWFDHLKGPRKQEGRSRVGDLKVARQEAYWS